MSVISNLTINTSKQKYFYYIIIFTTNLSLRKLDRLLSIQGKVASLSLFRPSFQLGR